MENLPNCPKCNSEYTYEDGSLLVCPECAYEWSPEANNEEENVIKVAAFACDNSKRLFEKLGFVKDKSITSFGSTYPGDDDSVYYELNLESNFYLSKLNKDDVRFISISMNNELYKFTNVVKMIKNHIFYCLM